MNSSESPVDCRLVYGLWGTALFKGFIMTRVIWKGELQAYFIKDHFLQIKKAVCEKAFGLQVKFLGKTSPYIRMNVPEKTNYSKIFNLHRPNGRRMLG